MLRNQCVYANNDRVPPRKTKKKHVSAPQVPQAGSRFLIDDQKLRCLEMSTGFRKKSGPDRDRTNLGNLAGYGSQSGPY